jgi:hypothetical protein
LDRRTEPDIFDLIGRCSMRFAALGRLGAIVCGLASAHCSSSDAPLPLIVRGDAVRILPIGVGGCPSGWGAGDFDDHRWTVARLPIGWIPKSGVCLRKQFDVPADLAKYRWLTIRLSSRARAQLNGGRPISSAVEQGGGLGWSTDDEAAAQASPRRDYVIDLRLFPELLHPTGNVLALQVAATPDPVDLEVTLAKDDGSDSDFVRVVKGPYQVRPSAASTRIAWESQRSAPSWALVDGQQYDGGWAVHHEVVVAGLSAGRLYSTYVETAQASALPPECRLRNLSGGARVISPLDDASDEFQRYVQRRDLCNRVAQAIHSDPLDLRAPVAGGRVRLAVVGDTRADTTLASAIIDAVAAEAPDLVIHTGDVVDSAFEDHWQAFFDGAKPMLARAPIAPAPGERDLGQLGVDRFAQLFAVDGTRPAGRAYAVDAGAVHVALLDSTANLADQAGWLDADLSAAEALGARHLFVVMHLGPWSGGPSGGNADALVIATVARRHRVDAVVSGHDAIYEHGIAGGLHYFVSGGGGARVDGVAITATTVVARGVPHYLVIDVEGGGATVRAKDVAAGVFDEVALVR